MRELEPLEEERTSAPEGADEGGSAMQPLVVSRRGPEGGLLDRLPQKVRLMNVSGSFSSCNVEVASVFQRPSCVGVS